MTKPIGDLHCHPSFKPANNTAINDIWTYKKNPCTKSLFKGVLGFSLRRILVNQFVSDLATYTQSNLDHCHDGHNRLLFLSIYPIERQFVKPNRPFQSSTFTQRFILGQVFGIKLKLHLDSKIFQVLTGFSEVKVTEYLDSAHESDEIDYFDNDLACEYSYLSESHNTASPNETYEISPSFKMVSNYEEYAALDNQNTIAGIVTIEGMHALGKYKRTDLFGNTLIDELSESNKNALQNSFINNVRRIKDRAEFEFTPFFITFAHHFNNLLTGHSKSFGDPKNKALPGFSNVFNQKAGLDLGITAFGKTLIKDHLLSIANGQRILIDTKHMSLEARNDYFNIVKSLREAGDSVPIIISHTAINGISTRARAAEHPDTNQLDKNSYISRWDINITDQDIREVFDSDGIIGVCMHDGRMPGGKFKALMKTYKKRFTSGETLNKLHTQMFLTNVFHIVKVNLEHIRMHNCQNPMHIIDEVNAWKTICLGSDNDGIVDPFDNFNSAKTLETFKNRVARSIELNFDPLWRKFKILNIKETSYTVFTENELQDLMLGLSAETISDMIFCDNIDAFLKKYFTRNYLESGVLNHTEATV
ncbi:hypothetical protein Q4566_04750 [Tamlana sp. 2_MG-2023]|uniref:hypothetical protein n=1 Tax=unclassified Tamlana TaxID=2614803 RepID=UPI0026E3261A|nr:MULTISPECIES: hypothetical protein [unclassified Tamlana]MDO6759501.1 hypothetical protein [Tamlana sp. 2_MG-2023]MDO6790360.1 hypothetical protein [Tamlana sp. 1_MG-2023]